jgi:hypothetical protein
VLGILDKGLNGNCFKSKADRPLTKTANEFYAVFLDVLILDALQKV